MTITIGHIDFDHATYDAESDVLYLRVGDAKPAAQTRATPEGHAIRYDDRGRVIGMTIVNAKWLAERDGEISVTEHVSAAVLAPALAGR
jgi:uncharacterized protein YuzE